MLLIQQSPSFRAWTSRALMVHFRRALLFLVVSPHQTINNNNNTYSLQKQQQQQTVYFSDAEDDEEILMINEYQSKKNEEKIFIETLFDRNQNNSNRIQMSQSKRHSLKEYVFKKLSEGINNSMIKSIRKETINLSSVESLDESSSSKVSSNSSSLADQVSQVFNSIQSPPTEQFEPSKYYSNQGCNSFSTKTINDPNINKNKTSDDLLYQHQTNPTLPSCQYTPINYQNQIYTLPPPHRSYFDHTVPLPFYPYCPSWQPSSSIYNSSDDDTSSSELNNTPLPKSSDQYSSLSDNEDDIYEKYQTSFSHILHQTKSQHTIRKEDKMLSMLLLEPNTSIITVRQLTYHPFNPNNINHLMTTSNIRVRLIANRKDSSIQCDAKPIGCKKPHNHQQTNGKSFGCFPIKYIQKPSFNNIIKSIPINIKQQEKSSLNSSTTTSIDQVNNQQSSISSNKKFESTSILIDIPFKMLYIDS